MTVKELQELMDEHEKFILEQIRNLRKEKKNNMWIVYLFNKQVINQNQCKWNLLPCIPIMKLVYFLPNKKYLIMEGFEKYIHIKEIYTFISGANGSVIDTVNLLGQHNDSIYQFSLNVRKNKALQTKNSIEEEFKPLKWNIVLKKFEFGKAQKLNPALWHSGIKSSRAITKIVKSI